MYMYKKERKANKVWISKETLDLVSTRRNLKVKRKTPEDYEQHRQCYKEVKKSARKDKRQWISDRCKDIEEKAGGAKDREGYALVRQLKGEFTLKTRTINNKNGKT